MPRRTYRGLPKKPVADVPQQTLPESAPHQTPQESVSRQGSLNNETINGPGPEVLWDGTNNPQAPELTLGYLFGDSSDDTDAGDDTYAGDDTDTGDDALLADKLSAEMDAKNNKFIGDDGLDLRGLATSFDMMERYKAYETSHNTSESMKKSISTVQKEIEVKVIDHKSILAQSAGHEKHIEDIKQQTIVIMEQTCTDETIELVQKVNLMNKVIAESKSVVSRTMMINEELLNGAATNVADRDKLMNKLTDLNTALNDHERDELKKNRDDVYDQLIMKLDAVRNRLPHDVKVDSDVDSALIDIGNDGLNLKELANSFEMMERYAAFKAAQDTVKTTEQKISDLQKSIADMETEKQEIHNCDEKLCFLKTNMSGAVMNSSAYENVDALVMFDLMLTSLSRYTESVDELTSLKDTYVNKAGTVEPHLCDQMKKLEELESALIDHKTVGLKRKRDEMLCQFETKLDALKARIGSDKINGISLQ